MEDTQTTLRDHIEQAIETHSEPDEQVSGRPRDESGRFASKAEQTKETPEIEATPAPDLQAGDVADQPVTPSKPRPTSWKKDYEEDWGKLDPRLQDYMHQREADFAKGVSTYKQNWEQAAPIWNAMQEFMPHLQQHGIQPQQWISSLGNAHLTLTRGSPEQKMQMFAKLATDYGVPLQALNGQQFDPQFMQVANELNQLKSQLNRFQTEREQMENAQMNSEISNFAKDKPYFDAVRETMAGLLQSGVASNLQTAYEKAIRLHDDIWQKEQETARQAQLAEAARDQQQKVAKARAAAVSPRSVSPTASVTGSGKKDIRSIIAEQLDGMGERV